MTWRMLVVRSLRFHWRSHLGVLLGAILGTAILTGALAVGDSVRYSLRRIALLRLGDIHLALNTRNRFFRSVLAEEVSSDLQAPVAPAILLRGTAAGRARSGDNESRAGQVQVIGVSDRFWKLGGAISPPGSDMREAVVLSENLAGKLGVGVGDDVLLRVDKPGLLSRDAPLSTITDASVTFNLPVAAISTDLGFGRFSLEANQIPPLNAFVPIELIQSKIGLEDQANVLLVGAKESQPITPSDATAALWRHWQLADAGLELRELSGRGLLELRTDRVFLDPPVGEAAIAASPVSQGVLTYFVNELRVRDRSTPYSTVTAMEGSVIPEDMKDDEVIINRWLADDLQARVGDSLKMTYWLVGPMRRLEEHSITFRIQGILPLTGDAADRSLMPDIPGLADKKNCRDWEPGVPIDLDRIRDKDQGYWSTYRGTPKAFITLSAGQKIWNNRFGDLSAVRYPASEQSRSAIEACLRQTLSPASLGLYFMPVREQALTAISRSMDFGQLFLGFSFFLIIASLLLTSLLFVLGIEQRAEEVGILLAVGFSPQRVQRLLLVEGGILAFVAGIAGAGCAVLYTRAVIHGLSTAWSGAVASASLWYHAKPATLIGGALAGFLVALLSIGLVVRKQARSPARELLASGAESETRLMASSPAGSISRWSGILTALIASAGALGLAGMALTGGQGHAPGYFFGAGALLLIGGMAASRALMAWLDRDAEERRLTVGSLGMRNISRRRGRSLSVVGLLACGTFLVSAIGANRHDPQEGARRRSSGTGGFALYGESTLPVYHSLNTREGLETLGLEPEDLRGAEIVPLRLREGDDASCLNLNRAQVPRLLGIQPESFRSREAFSFTKTINRVETGSSWSLLERTESDGAIPAVGDTNTVVWSLGKSVGDTIAYVDERGNTRPIRIVGILGNSVLQGSLIISESNFIDLFPSQSGYRVFLVDMPPESSAGEIASFSQILTRAMEDVGLDLTPSPERLANFNTVENTYLSIFAMLGGLGLLLGSAGLGVVVLRNVLERRSELAILRAVGFRSRALFWLVFSEHALLLSLGLGVGVFAAAVAVLPSLRSPGAEVPYASLTLTLAAVLLSGLIWTWGATALALRSPLLEALRNE